jgi:hypothetical protein
MAGFHALDLIEAAVMCETPLNFKAFARQAKPCQTQAAGG